METGPLPSHLLFYHSIISYLTKAFLSWFFFALALISCYLRIVVFKGWCLESNNGGLMPHVTETVSEHLSSTTILLISSCFACFFVVFHALHGEWPLENCWILTQAKILFQVSKSWLTSSFDVVNLKERLLITYLSFLSRSVRRAWTFGKDFVDSSLGLCNLIGIFFSFTIISDSLMVSTELEVSMKVTWTALSGYIPSNSRNYAFNFTSHKRKF